MVSQPVPDDLEDFGGDGLLDGGVLGRRAGKGMLEEMIEIRNLADVRLGVPGSFQGFLKQGQIHFGRHLKILLSKEG